jgi:hypothetical protein
MVFCMVCELVPVGPIVKLYFCFIASLLQTFNAELAPNHPEPKWNPDIVMVPDHGKYCTD